MNLSFFLIRICFNPRGLAGGRDIGISAVRDILIVSIPVPSQSRALAISQSRALALSQSRALAISRSRNLALSQSRALAISQSRNNELSRCKRQGSGKSKQWRKSARRRPQSEVRYGCTTRGSLSMQEECPCILSSQRRSKGHWTQWNKQHPGLPGKTDALLSRYRFFRII